MVLGAGVQVGGVVPDSTEAQLHVDNFVEDEEEHLEEETAQYEAYLPSGPAGSREGRAGWSSDPPEEGPQKSPQEGCQSPHEAAHGASDGPSELDPAWNIAPAAEEAPDWAAEEGVRCGREELEDAELVERPMQEARPHSLATWGNVEGGRCLWTGCQAWWRMTATRMPSPSSSSPKGAWHSLWCALELALELWRCQTARQ